MEKVEALLTEILEVLVSIKNDFDSVEWYESSDEEEEDEEPA